MVYQMFCVRDTKAGVFGRPFFLQSRGVAIRSFDDEVNRVAADNTMHHHAADFVLYALGEWDDSTGEFRPVLPAVVISGDQVRRPTGMDKQQSLPLEVTDNA